MRPLDYTETSVQKYHSTVHKKSTHFPNTNITRVVCSSSQYPQ